MIILLMLAVLVVGFVFGLASFAWIIKRDALNDSGFCVTYVDSKRGWLIIGDPELVMRKVDNWRGNKTVIDKQTLLQKQKHKNE